MTVSDEVPPRRARAERDASSIEDGRSTPKEDASGREAGHSAVTIYRWTCPICGESRTGMASDGENPLGKAEFSLRQHVKTSEGDGHGAANVYPPRFDPDAADRAVSLD